MKTTKDSNKEKNKRKIKKSKSDRDEKKRNKGVPLFQLFEGNVCDTLFETIYALPPPPPPPDERLAVACIRLLLVPQLLPPVITPLPVPIPVWVGLANLGSSQGNRRGIGWNVLYEYLPSQMSAIVRCCGAD